MVLTFPSQLGVLKYTFENVLQDTFQIMFQTFLLTVVDFFNVGHVVCSSSIFSKREIFIFHGVVLFSPLQPKMFSELPPKSRYNIFRSFVN